MADRTNCLLAVLRGGRVCVCVVGLMVAGFSSARAGGVTSRVDTESNWTVLTMQQGETTIRLVPEAGCNVVSIVHRGSEYLRVPEKISQARGVGFGVPLLYPMPNRVRGAAFLFEGDTFPFPANSSGNFIHGLVHSEPFRVVRSEARGDSVLVECAIDFKPETRQYELFPWRHQLRVAIEVREGSVSWTYSVENSEPARSLPFGFALHPYFVYLSPREQTKLTVPATHWMESEAQLPSGNLRSLDDHPLDARSGRSLQGYVADDVFLGMRPEQPAAVRFTTVDRGIRFETSAEFTHLVVYTPDRPFFCIENQTCSTDAHNLAAAGKQDVAHLQVCSPGETMSGTVTYRLQ